ncbi:glucosaminidase domain-containing protein [Vibrio sp.]|nr:glucosaminidase domain-containing protein [Vibrio sp.]
MRKRVLFALATMVVGCSDSRIEQTQKEQKEESTNSGVLTRVDEEKKHTVDFSLPYLSNSIRVTTAGNKVSSFKRFDNISDVNTKKRAFFEYLKDGVALENSRVIKERTFIIGLWGNLDANKTLARHELELLKLISTQYKVKFDDNNLSNDWFKLLLSHVDVIPEALVLSQAANESAWGTSRFVREGNNYFGQWCYTKGCGLIPKQRTEGMVHEVAAFDTPQESIYGYFMNINRNKAYRSLRNIRSQRASKGLPLHSPDAAKELAEGLLHYSERGVEYVQELQSMIRYNNKYWTIYSNEK